MGSAPGPGLPPPAKSPSCAFPPTDRAPETLETAALFGFRSSSGAGTGLAVLRAAGGGEVRLIAICIDAREAASRIVDLVRAEFPGTKLYVRSFDRRHTLQL